MFIVRPHIPVAMYIVHECTNEMTPNYYIGRTGLSEAKVDKIREGLSKVCGPNAGFCTALQVGLVFFLQFLLSYNITYDGIRQGPEPGIGTGGYELGTGAVE